ncbi:MAG: hypothetical protein ACNA8W_23190, partial [Bradymonadaceae bacterium]
VAGHSAPAEPQPGCSPDCKFGGSVARHQAIRTNDPPQTIKRRRSDRRGPMNVAEAIVPPFDRAFLLPP